MKKSKSKMTNKHQTDDTLNTKDEHIEAVDESAETVDNDEAPEAQNGAGKSRDDALEEDTRIAELEKEVMVNLEGWQRSRAEFANYKKRTEREMREVRERAALDTIVKILPIMDDFERALGNIPEDLEDHPWISGTALIMRKFDKILEEYNITVLDPVGDEFDPRLHEAVGMDDSGEYESGRVTMTLQKGYSSGDRVLRPALVRVAQ